MFQDENIRKILKVDHSTPVTDEYVQAVRQLITVFPHGIGDPESFIAATKLITLGLNRFTTDQLLAVKKLMGNNRYGTTLRKKLPYDKITRNDVEAMTLLITNPGGRFFNTSQDSLNHSFNLGESAGTPDQPSQPLLEAAKYFLGNGVTDFGANEIMAFVFLVILKPDELNGAVPIHNPSFEQIQVMADFNEKINQSTIINDPASKLNAKREVAWRMRTGHGIPNALALVGNATYNHAQPQQDGLDKLLGIVWLRPGMTHLNDDKGNKFITLNTVNTDSRDISAFAILHDKGDDLVHSLPRNQQTDAFVTFNGLTSTSPVNNDGIPAVRLEDARQRH